jgi:hypothetical protein
MASSIFSHELDSSIRRQGFIDEFTGNLLEVEGGDRLTVIRAQLPFSSLLA